VRVVELLGLLLGTVLGLLAINEVQALSLGELVCLTTSETSKQLLREGMVNSLA
jgi:hypothetical protein